MVLLIDACNIRAGGGQVHLLELLRDVDPVKYDFSKIIVCAPSATIEKISESSRLVKYSHPLMDGGYFQRWMWRKFLLPTLLKSLNAFLFIPGTMQPPFRWPYVTMCQNLLPLEYSELFRYGISFMTIRLLVLRFLHLRTYASAVGTVFLSIYSYNAVSPSVKRRMKSFKVIPHGLNHNIFTPVLADLDKNDETSFRLLYVSILDVYKHQDKVCQAVINLRKKGHDIKVTLVGPAYVPYGRKIRRMITTLGRQDDISYLGEIPYKSMGAVYRSHDAFIFASSCETFGMILTEAMATGLPILCSDKSSLPEIVKDGALYFDPLNVSSIEDAIMTLTTNFRLRKDISEKAVKRSKSFSWKKCKDSTFNFLSETAKNSGF